MSCMKGGEMAIINGNSRVNRLRGAAETDIITGLGGADILLGGAGDDIIFGDDSSLAAPFGFGGDELFGGEGNDVLIGGAGGDRLVGGGGDDTLIGGFGDGTRYGLADGGNDSFLGGGGIDTAVIAFDRVASIALDLSNARAQTAITADGRQIGTITGVEIVRFHGGAGGDAIIGGRLGDMLAGGMGDDILTGGEGGDRIVGGGGDDRLDGGVGFDVVSYEDAHAGVTVDLRRAGSAQDTGGAGKDTLAGFEQVDGSLHSDLLIGSDGADFLSGGAGGNDRLMGGDGADSFYQYRPGGTVSATRIFGGAGDDVATMAGAAGARDRFTFNGGADADAAHVSGAGRFELSLGSGEDLAGITLGAASVRVVLGGGVDTVRLETAAALSPRWSVPVIADFAAGDNGDRIDLRAFLTAEAVGFAAGSDPFTGHARLNSVGADTLIEIDRDAGGSAFGFEAVLRLEDTALADLTAFNFGGFDPIAIGAPA